MPMRRSMIELMKWLDDEHQKLTGAHRLLSPGPNEVPVGGGHMDPFFRSEAIRGCLGALRAGKSLEEAIADGKTVGEISVQIWNGRREYQVHRWKEGPGEFLESLIRQYQVLGRKEG